MSNEIQEMLHEEELMQWGMLIISKNKDFALK